MRHFRFGVCETPEPSPVERGDDEPRQMHLNTYVPSPVDIELRSTHSRYFEEAGELKPQDMGIMLHRAFEHAATREDITTAIDNMRRDRLLTPEEATRLAERVAKTLDESIAGEWFDGSWSDVRCEESIIVPNEQHSRRPDRVMSKGERCVIIDYKFGAELPSHREQIAHYAELMRGMGYKHVEGYVWYVNEGKIVKN